MDKAFTSSVTMTDRAHIELTGITEVVAFDDTGIELDGKDGRVTIDGKGLRIVGFDGQTTRLVAEGRITGINWYDPHEGRSTGLFSRLFS